MSCQEGNTGKDELSGQEDAQGKGDSSCQEGTGGEDEPSEQEWAETWIRHPSGRLPRNASVSLANAAVPRRARFGLDRQRHHTTEQYDACELCESSADFRDVRTHEVLAKAELFKSADRHCIMKLNVFQTRALFRSLNLVPGRTTMKKLFKEVDKACCADVFTAANVKPDRIVLASWLDHLLTGGLKLFTSGPREVYERLNVGIFSNTGGVCSRSVLCRK